jgi:hypothetical protein
MVALRELGLFNTLPADSPLRDSPLWDRDVESIHPEQLLAFVKRMEMLGQGEQAMASAEIILGTLHHCIGRGDIDGSPLAGMRPPKKRLTHAELRESLSPMSAARKDAVLFAADASLALDEVIALRWRRAYKLTLSERGRKILRDRPRHMFTDLVFWELIEGKTLPMISLKQHYEAATSYLPWHEFVGQYQAAIEIDIEGDLALIKEAVRGELACDEADSAPAAP